MDARDHLRLGPGVPRALGVMMTQSMKLVYAKLVIE